jgi:hypothetical protein
MHKPAVEELVEFLFYDDHPEIYTVMENPKTLTWWRWQSRGRPSLQHRPRFVRVHRPLLQLSLTARCLLEVDGVVCSSTVSVTLLLQG